jgi:hypothetical protein
MIGALYKQFSVLLLDLASEIARPTKGPLIGFVHPLLLFPGGLTGHTNPFELF